MKLDCLLVHTPKFNNFNKCLGSHTLGMNIASGVFSIADYLSKRGLNTRILHLGIEKALNPRFSLFDFVAKSKPKVVGFSLHWHMQSALATEIAAQLKKDYPKIFIALGGITASFFHKDIIDNFSFIDAVIRGDGERPLLLLAESVLRKEKDFFSIPNLTWRYDGATIINQAVYQMPQKELDGLNYANFDLLVNKSFYTSCSSYFPVWFENLSTKVNMALFPAKQTFFAPVSKGCPVSCSYCGGRNAVNRDGQKECFLYHSPESVFFSIKAAHCMGFKTIHINYLPVARRDYYQTLFSMIRESGLKLNCILDCFVLPKKEIVELFIASFNKSKHTFIVISPESADEGVRRKNKGYFFTNQEMLSFLSYTDKLDLPVIAFFSLGLPFETQASLEKLIELKKYLKKDFRNVKAVASSVEIEPGSLLYRHPQEYNIVKLKDSCRDFFRGGTTKEDRPNSPGFYSEQMVEHSESKGDRLRAFERKIDELRCGYFCPLEDHLLTFFPLWWQNRISVYPFFRKVVCRTFRILMKILDFFTGGK